MHNNVNVLSIIELYIQKQLINLFILPFFKKKFSHYTDWEINAKWEGEKNPNPTFHTAAKKVERFKSPEFIKT